MSKIPVKNYELYHIKTIDIEKILRSNLHLSTSNDKITNLYWYPNINIIKKLVDHLQRLNITTRIIDVGCGNTPFPTSTHIVDFSDVNHPDKNIIKLDLNFDKFPLNSIYNFLYCRHTLEDIQNPQNAFNEFIRISPLGYIETPSPLIEFSNGVDAGGWFGVNSDSYKGYIHHRYIVWSDIDNNTLYFLPKYPIIEYIKSNDNTKKLLNYIANNYPLYWNNYYYWDINDDRFKPNICVYVNGVNLDLGNDYERLLNTAINKSIEYAERFVSKI